ncbi:MAG: enoyl-CoA hydratase/isomerase family protein [Acidimicrobiia bacterium]|nr:enoyl-CoA hydratase/isomerase family protein [Acidimicrobiia bacterium]
MEPPVLVERREHVLEITLNRPDSRNSMTPEMLPAFGAAIREASIDGQARCVIITGAGPSFCAGADFKPDMLEQAGKPPPDAQYEVYAAFLEILRIKVPVIAAMQGHAVGGGLGLAMLCDLRVASEESKYGANFVRLGLSPGMAISYMLPRLIGVPRALELMLTGRIITGAKALDVGIVNHAVPADDVLARAREIADEIASAAPIAVRWTKELTYRHLEWDPQAAARLEGAFQAFTGQTRDFAEGVAALLEKRPARFSGDWETTPDPAPESREHTESAQRD